jgi:putative ABC transport system substrate-binding protein
MRRRAFITLLGGAAATWPLAARGQQKLPVIGFVGAATAVAWAPWVAGFVQRLAELGWINGRTVTIEFRWAEGRSDRYVEIAAEFVRLKVDVIVTTAGSPTAAAKQATATIPIVFTAIGDPIGAGLVASLARPGGNATGLSMQESDIVGKRLELLRAIVPDLRRLAVMGNIGAPGAVTGMQQVEAAARMVGLDVVTSGIRGANDLEPAFEALKGHADALYIVTDPLMGSNRVRLVILALGARLPTMNVFREYVDAGGLISYGVSFTHMFRRAAEYVDKILRGTKPGDIPVEQPTQFELVINRTTAKVLGLEVPPLLLAFADEVIE